MSDLFEDPAPGAGGNTPEFSVSEISGAIKRTLEGEFGRIRVRGEVGRVFKARSGHLYYDVKDDRSVLACTTWKGQIASLSVVPEEGLEVVVTGRLTAFGAQSKYNMNVDEVEVDEQEVGLTVCRADDVVVPDLVVKRPCLGHGSLLGPSEQTVKRSKVCEMPGDARRGASSRKGLSSFIVASE